MSDKLPDLFEAMPDQVAELNKTIDSLAAKHGEAMTDIALKIHNSKVLAHMMSRHGVPDEIVLLLASFVGSLISEMVADRNLDGTKAVAIADGVAQHMVTLRQELVERMGGKVDGVDVSATLNDIFHKE